MAKREYLTAPVPSEKMPAGIPYILKHSENTQEKKLGLK